MYVFHAEITIKSSIQLQHNKHNTQNCMYKRSSWWWTHDVLNV